MRWLILSVLLCCAPVSAQKAAKPLMPMPESAATAVERLILSQGRLLRKQFATVGSVQGKFEDYLGVETVVVAEAGPTGSGRVFGLRLQRASEPRTEKAVGFVDYDEAGALAEAIALMRKTAKDMKDETHENTEVEFRTRGGTSTGFLQTSKEQTGFVTVNERIGDTEVFFDIEKLEEVEKLIREGVAKLKAAGAK